MAKYGTFTYSNQLYGASTKVRGTSPTMKKVSTKPTMKRRMTQPLMRRIK